MLKHDNYYNLHSFFIKKVLYLYLFYGFLCFPECVFRYYLEYYVVILSLVLSLETYIMYIIIYTFMLILFVHIVKQHTPKKSHI